MATIRTTRRRNVQLARPQEVEWVSARRGLNLLLQDTELGNEEVRKSDNLMLKGAGILTQRPGTGNYFLAGSGKVRNMFPFYPKSGAKELVTFTDAGYFVKKNSGSYTIIPGSSLPSGTEISGAQIYDKLYLTSISQNLRRYDGTTITPYVGISRPTSLSATKTSGTSGTFTWSWGITAESDTGETLLSTTVQLSGLPENFTTLQYVTLSWPSVTDARGYVVYGRENGGETFVTRIPPTSTSWVDDGNNIPSTFTFPPEADFTAGPKGKIITTYKEKLVVGNLENNPSRVMGSGGGVNIDKFHWSKGGFVTDINKDDGQEVSGLIEYEGKIIVWKTRSIYQITISYNSSLGIVEPTVQRITGAVGCVAPRSVVQVENDVFYVGRRAGGGISLNSLGYEPNFAQVLRTTEISARVRPELESINQNRLDEIWAIYWKNIYWLFYPVGTSSMKCLGYDRERLAWIGPFDFPNNPSSGAIFYDSDGMERVVYGDGDDGYVTEVSDNYETDKGTAFTWTYLSKKESLKRPFLLKYLQSQLVHLRSVKGTINVSVIVEDINGVSSTAASITIEGGNKKAGWGSFSWGSTKWGHKSQASAGTTNLQDIIKYISLNKPNVRTYQVQISSTGGAADIVGLKTLLNLLSPYAIPPSWRS